MSSNLSLELESAMKYVQFLNLRSEALFKKQEFGIKVACFAGFLFAALQVLLVATVIPEGFLNLHAKFVFAAIILTAFGPLGYGLLMAELTYIFGLLSRMLVKYREYLESGVTKSAAIIFVSHVLIMHLLFISAIIVLVVYGNSPITYVFIGGTALYDFKFHKYEL